MTYDDKRELGGTKMGLGRTLLGPVSIQTVSRTDSWQPYTVRSLQMRYPQAKHYQFITYDIIIQSIHVQLTNE